MTTSKKMLITSILIILGLSLIAGGITAGVLLTRQSNPPADALTDTVYINADGTTATSSSCDWELEIYYSSTTATTCRLDSVTRRSGSTATTIVIPSSINIDGTSRNLTSMYSSSSSSGSVFYSVRSYITEVTLPATVTTIGDRVFYNCSKLMNIDLTNISSWIGEDAFYNCDSLTSINLPNATTIYESAFSSCDSLSTVNLGDNLNRIYEGAFGRCISLSSIYIPASVTSIGAATSGSYRSSYDSFSGCTNLTAIEVDENNNNYMDDNGVLYNKDGTTLLKFPEGSLLTTYNILPSTKTIHAGAFKGCVNLEYAIIPEGVTSIGYSAFSECTNLKEIVIPEGVTRLYGNSFYGCTSLESISILSAVIDIALGGGSVFYNCTSLTNVYYAGDINSWVSIGFTNYYDNPLYYAKNFYIDDVLVTDINIDTATEINPYSFDHYASLKTVQIGAQVASIGERAFGSCISLTSITVDSSNQNFSSLSGVLFNKDKSTLIQYPNGKSSSTYTTPTSVTTLGDYSFSGETNLQTLTLRTNVKTIGSYAFSNSNLVNLNMPANSVTLIKERAFSGCELRELILPEGLITIEDWALGNSDLREITIPESVQSIGSYAFANMFRLTDVYYNGNINDWVSIDLNDSPFAYAENFYINNRLVTTANINTATSISAYSFEDYEELKEVTIGEQVTSIGNYAFLSCSSLTSVTFENDLTDSSQIGTRAFSSGNTNAKYYFDKLNTYNLARSNTNKFTTTNFIYNGITITVNSTTGGTATGGGAYDTGGTATLTATANNGYEFLNWTNSSGAVLSTANPYTFTVTQSMTITANFVASNYTVIMESSGYPSKIGGLVGGFENTGWNGTFGTEHVRSGDYSLKITGSAGSPESVISTTNVIAIDDTTKNHVYYVQYWGYQETRTNGSTQIYWPIEEPSFGSLSLGPAGQWNKYSFYGTRSANPLTAGKQLRVDYDNNGTAGVLWVDDILLLDLTEIFGAGNEPSKEWCDANIISGTNTQTVQYNTDTNLENRPGSVAVAYNFAGWSTSPKTTSSTNQTVSYANGASINNIAEAGSTITLYGVWQIKSYTITVQSNNTNFGTVSGGGTYNHGATATLTATANEGYYFSHWQDSTGANVSQSPSFQVTVTSSTTYTAIFERITYTLNIYSSNESYGTVSGGGTYDYHQSVTVSASTNTGYTVDYWLVNNTRVPATSNTYTFTITQNTTITVYFKSSLAQARATAGGEVRITGNDIGLNNTSATVTYTALAYNGYYLIGWYLDNTLYNSTATKITLTQSQAQSICVTAVFSTNSTETPNYTFNREDTTTISSSIGGEARMVGYSGEYNETILIATVQKGYEFTGWYIDGVLYSTYENITLDTNNYKGKVIEARFELINNGNINDDLNN